MINIIILVQRLIDQDSLRDLLEKKFKTLIFDSAQHENPDKSVSKWWKILVQKK